MLKSFEVISLNGVKGMDYKFDFFNDLNIFTGRNGSGKTTLMKLLWYLITPNRRIAPETVKFGFARLVTETYELSASVKANADEGIPKKIEWSFKEFKTGAGIQIDYEDLMSMRGMSAMDSIDLAVERAGDQHTLFFPTFRRLEGGFDSFMSTRIYRRQRRMVGGKLDELSEYLESYSQALSSANHTFVTSISTRDIENLISSEYAARTEITNKAYLAASRDIEALIDEEDTKTKSPRNTEDVVSSSIVTSLDLMAKIKDKLKEAKNKDTDNRRPFKILSQLVSEVFRDKTIKVSPTLGFGNADAKVGANNLSAGEKQMFGFLSYNALLKSSIFFIDEPELSLNVDWQRILFRKLMEQGSNNQFIVATHSPFIYSQYPQRELFLGADRGFGTNV